MLRSAGVQDPHRRFWLSTHRTLAGSACPSRWAVDSARARAISSWSPPSERRRRSLGGDDELMARARALSAAHLDGAAEPASVRWVDNQHRRWGSCTPADRSIRLSSRLRSMPEYVVDYVLVHELSHLLEAGHDERFWALVARYPRAERARGFLEGVELANTAGEAAAGHPSAADHVD